ncbi:TPA: hypothetical protein ACG0AP_003555 [Elizabethkingia anophelis]
MKQIFALFKTLSVMFIIIVVYLYASIKLHDIIRQIFDIPYNKDNPSFAYVITLILSMFIVIFIMMCIQQIFRKKIKKAVFKILDAFFED